MDENLKEALGMVELLSAQLHLAWHERQELDARTVNKSVKDAGKLLAKHGYRSDMAAGSDL